MKNQLPTLAPLSFMVLRETAALRTAYHKKKLTYIIRAGFNIKSGEAVFPTLWLSEYDIDQLAHHNEEHKTRLIAQFTEYAASVYRIACEHAGVGAAC